MKPSAKERLMSVQAAISSKLIPLGFTQDKLDWRRKLDSVVQQFSLRKSRYGQSYFAEWGLSLRRAGAALRPKLDEMHFTWSIPENVVVLAERARYIQAFDFEDPEPDEEVVFSTIDKMPKPLPRIELTVKQRIQIVREFLDRHIVPCFTACETIDSLKKAANGPKAPFPALIDPSILEELWPED